MTTPNGFLKSWSLKKRLVLIGACCIALLLGIVWFSAEAKYPPALKEVSEIHVSVARYEDISFTITDPQTVAQLTDIFNTGAEYRERCMCSIGNISVNFISANGESYEYIIGTNTDRQLYDNHARKDVCGIDMDEVMRIFKTYPELAALMDAANERRYA